MAGKFLKPGEEYFYRFETRTGTSPVGRFRTAPPADSREPVKIVFFSCQDWQAGYFGAHSAIAARGRRPGGLPGRLHLRAQLLRRARARTRSAPTATARSRRWPSTAPSTACTRPTRPAGDARGAPVRGDLGRPRGRGQLRRRRIPGEATQQIRGCRSSHAPANGYRAFFEYMPFAPLDGRAARSARPATARMRPGPQRRAVPARRAPVPRRPALRRRVLRPPCPEAEERARGAFLGDRQKAWLKRRLRGLGARPGS